MELKDSKTKINLLRAFAGESQARNRYDYAASTAKSEGLYVIEQLFKYTANQEEAHGRVFYTALKEFNGENIVIDGAYPIGDYMNTLELLKSAKHNEGEEHNVIYKDFAAVAKEEGFTEIATTFENIASIEKEHEEKFARYASELENGTLFKKDTNIQWMCTNCGFIYEGKEAPKACPVCSHPQGYFIDLKEAEFSRK